MKDSVEKRMGRHKKWKDAIIGTNQQESPREDLSESQKNWVKRAWTWASVAIFGMDEECLPNAIPQYSERKGWFWRKSVNPHIHHLSPVGIQNRVMDEPYNEPRNLAPVDEVNHVGKNAHEDTFVIHRDAMIANQEYGIWAKGGKKGTSPYEQMGIDRRIATKHGDLYHDSRLDEHLRETTDRVVTEYARTHKEDKWPIRKKGVQTITNVWNEENQRWEQIES